MKEENEKDEKVEDRKARRETKEKSRDGSVYCQPE